MNTYIIYPPFNSDPAVLFCIVSCDFFGRYLSLVASTFIYRRLRWSMLRSWRHCLHMYASVCMCDCQEHHMCKSVWYSWCECICMHVYVCVYIYIYMIFKDSYAKCCFGDDSTCTCTCTCVCACVRARLQGPSCMSE
jgi:hypothetical protein